MEMDRGGQRADEPHSGRVARCFGSRGGRTVGSRRILEDWVVPWVSVFLPSD
jgi:hypothetical protein